MNYKFEIIKLWPKTHNRNIDIAIKYAEGNSYVNVGKMFNTSRTTVRRVYISLMGKLCEQLFSIPYREAFKDKKYYLHEDRLKILKSYKEFCISNSQYRK